jgi:hypothetical protein
MARLLDVYIKSKNATLSAVRKQISSRNTFNPIGIKQHQINTLGDAGIYTVDKIIDGTEINILYVVTYFVLENVWTAWFPKESANKIIESIQLGRIVIIDYDKRRFSIERPEIADSDSSINMAMVEDIKSHILELEENNNI